MTMTIIRPEELRDMTQAEREVELEELQTELLNHRATQATGGAVDDAGEIKEIRRAIARIKTIQREEGDIAEQSSAGNRTQSGDLPDDEE